MIRSAISRIAGIHLRTITVVCAAPTGPKTRGISTIGVTGSLFRLRSSIRQYDLGVATSARATATVSFVRPNRLPWAHNSPVCKTKQGQAY